MPGSMPRFNSILAVGVLVSHRSWNVSRALVINPPAGLGAQSAQHMRDTARAVSRGGGLGGFMIKACLPHNLVPFGKDHD
jgi:hypothetical protein